MTEAQLTKELLSDQVYDRIRTSILDGERVPGARLVESEIARRLGVSQAPVREAVKRLVHEGLVTSAARRGSYVTEVSAEEREVARQVRASLERVGARAAIPQLGSDDVRELRAIVSAMGVAVDGGDWAKFRVLDAQFHGSVLALSGHAILTRIWASLEPLLMSQRAIGDPAYPGNRSKVVGWHEDLIDVLEAGDLDAAGDAFFEHAAGQLPQ
ncbi:GntR family transcriptional regulator (plasmid) [Coraliomargarita sp. W4R53]